MDKTGNELAGAIWGEERKYRYLLWRYWKSSLPKILYIGLNPSTANHKTNDNTINRLIGLTSDMGYGGFYIANLFGYVTPYPKDLLEVKDPVGEQDKWLLYGVSRVEKIVFMWGSFKEAKVRAKKVIDQYGYKAYCFKKNIDGSPIHPLYLPKGSQLIKFEQ